MKTILTILFFVPLICWGQSNEFNDYLSKFRAIEIPLEINQANFHEQFPGSVWNKPVSIDEKYVKDFIFDEDSTVSRFITPDYGYGYGMKWETCKYHIVIVMIQRNQGDNIFNFDRLDLMLILYDRDGVRLDRKIISRNNEVWFSNISVKTCCHIDIQQIMMNIKSSELIDINK
ncbi:MAG: hypothetical protein LBR64_08270, partial [Dysgonamonadaceae bacterium]|nr:hypothetical protein [Dysgonamonadaceae bacterium]